MSKVLKMYPFILNYKSIHISITENDESIFIELTSPNMIHTTYLPNNPKGNKMTAKVMFSNADKLGKKDKGISMHLTINPDLNWFYSVLENENGVDIEFNTGNYYFIFEQTIKTNSLYSLTAQLQVK